MGDSPDQILATIEAIVDGATTITQQADAILTLVGSLNQTSDNLNPRLTTHAKAAFETFWADWSAELLGMAASAESLGTLLANAAIAYLEVDSNITKAFHGDPALEKDIDDKIANIKNQSDNFKKTFDEDVNKQKEVSDNAKEDTKKAENEGDDTLIGYETNGAPMFKDKNGNKYYLNKDGKKVKAPLYGADPDYPPDKPPKWKPEYFDGPYGPVQKKTPPV